MAKQRIIDTKFWSDTYISNLETIEKLLFIYLLTNEKTKLCGAYELPEKIMQIETGIEAEKLKEILGKFEKNGKIFYESGWILLKNFIKYQNLKNPKISAGIRRSIDELPLKIRKKLYRMDRVSIAYLYPIDTLSHSNSNSNSNSNLNSPPTPSLREGDGARELPESESEEGKISLQKFVAECLDRDEPEYRVLADWAETLKPSFTTPEQWDGFVKRNLSPAKKIVPYSRDQIIKAFKQLERAKASGWLGKFTLEALWKEITNPTT